MNEILINAFIEAIMVGNMTIDQVPIPYQEEVKKKLNTIQEEEVNEE